MLAIDKARRLRSRPEQCAPPAPETQRALRPRPQNPHRSRPTKQRPFLPAVSSLRGFRTPAPRKTPRACKGPASETLQRSCRCGSQLERRRRAMPVRSWFPMRPVRCANSGYAHLRASKHPENCIFPGQFGVGIPGFIERRSRWVRRMEIKYGGNHVCAGWQGHTSRTK